MLFSNYKQMYQCGLKQHSNCVHQRANPVTSKGIDGWWIISYAWPLSDPLTPSKTWAPKACSHPYFVPKPYPKTPDREEWPRFTDHVNCHALSQIPGEMGPGTPIPWPSLDRLCSSPRAPRWVRAATASPSPPSDGRFLLLPSWVTCQRPASP